KMAEGSSRLTATGQTMGSVRYMSPEQVRGQTVDARSDLYSLGATLYEAVVGDTPFDGATHFEIMMKHLSEAVPSARANGGDTPGALDRVLERAMPKDSKARYQPAAEFLKERGAGGGDAPGEPEGKPAVPVVADRPLDPPLTPTKTPAPVDKAPPPAPKPRAL